MEGFGLLCRFCCLVLDADDFGGRADGTSAGRSRHFGLRLIVRQGGAAAAASLSIVHLTSKERKSLKKEASQ